MSAFAQSLFGQILKTLGGPWLCVVLCFALVTSGLVVVTVVNQTIKRKPVVEWITKIGTGRMTFPNTEKK